MPRAGLADSENFLSGTVVESSRSWRVGSRAIWGKNVGIWRGIIRFICGSTSGALGGEAASSGSMDHGGLFDAIATMYAFLRTKGH